MTTSAVRREPRFVFLTDAPSSADEGRFGWRLVAANNRPLGRGISVATSLDACRASVWALHTRVAELTTAVASDDGRGMWFWRLRLADEPAAVSARPYLRRVECLRGLAQFVAALRASDPVEGVVRHYGPHALRGYETAVAS
ncbi:MAG TPA: hypothetical protein VHS54_03760 [Jatrophihabitans sp.]|jgi:hypothetical protein|nr:hypothetical protein [Jatrophihabitans sp.]